VNRQSNKIYWLAGLLEGEAFFGISSNKHPRIQLYMCDLDTVQKARDIIDSSINILTNENKSEEFNRKIQYSFSVNGQLAAEWMMTLYILMSNRRKEKIRETLQIWKNHQYIDRVTRARNTHQIRRNNKMVKMIMMSRKVSESEAIKILEESLTPKDQTIN
jgi:hypothetical protein